MGNQENQVREIINVKFSCYNDAVLSNTIFDFDKNCTIKEMIKEFNRRTKFEKNRSSFYGTQFHYVYKGFPLKTNSKELIKDIFKDDENVTIIINVDYGCLII